MIVPICWAGMPRSFWKAGAREPTSEKIRLEMNEIDPTIMTRRVSDGIRLEMAVPRRIDITACLLLFRHSGEGGNPGMPGATPTESCRRGRGSGLDSRLRGNDENWRRNRSSLSRNGDGGKGGAFP